MASGGVCAGGQKCRGPGYGALAHGSSHPAIPRRQSLYRQSLYRQCLYRQCLYSHIVGLPAPRRWLPVRTLNDCSYKELTREDTVNG